MRNGLITVVAMGLLSTFAACAMDAPDESETSSAVSIGLNYVRSTTPLAVRSCDNPGACDTGLRLHCRGNTTSDTVNVDVFDSGTKMARIGTNLWALADGVDGEVYLSANAGPCN